MRALHDAIKIVDDCAIVALYERNFSTFMQLQRVHTYLIARASLAPGVR